MASPNDRPQPIILDCDPGHDDALAILLALARPELELLAVTTVAGNAPLSETTRNAGSVLALAGRSDVPLAAGADRPLVRPQSTAAYVHGTSGLDGAALPVPDAEPRPEGALALTSVLLETAERPITLVGTGPATNIATLLEARPDLHRRIAGICLMGGAIGAGNKTASAEFNAWADPEAAALVLESGLPVTMVGLDVTHQALVPVDRSDRWAELGSRTGAVFADLFRYFAVFHRDRYGWDGSPIHDAVAVAHVALPALVETQPLPGRRRDQQRAHARTYGGPHRGTVGAAGERRGRRRHRRGALHQRRREGAGQLPVADVWTELRRPAWA